MPLEYEGVIFEASSRVKCISGVSENKEGKIALEIEYMSIRASIYFQRVYRLGIQVVTSGTQPQTRKLVGSIFEPPSHSIAGREDCSLIEQFNNSSDHSTVVLLTSNFCSAVSAVSQC